MDALKEMDRGKLRFIIRTPIVILFLLQFSNFAGSMTVMTKENRRTIAEFLKFNASVLPPSMEIA